MTISSSLSDVFLTPQLPRRNRLHPVAIVPGGGSGSWARPPAGCRCTDGLGFQRRDHDFSISARDGMRCLHCGALEPTR